VPASGQPCETMKTFRDIIDLWPTIAALADDLGLKYDRVAQWAKRDSIPGPFFADVARAAKGRDIKVSVEDLVRAAALSQGHGHQGHGVSPGNSHKDTDKDKDRNADKKAKAHEKAA
jgi:hypothetical protein